MGTISNQITENLKTAMRAKDTQSLNTLRSLKSAIKNAAIAKGGADAELDDAEETNIIRKQVKQRQDSIEQFEKAGRTELADIEKAEIAILERYLPAALSADELASLVEAAIAESGAIGRADMGKVMKILQDSTAGRADGKTLSQEVMKRLSA
ncbi:MAG: GatB/YqeY domain-containing protein [Verrucomicrobia bacterium]|nr:GatB/YqeY domain-containing protein [Verrucomicrobiota bacterium]